MALPVILVDSNAVGASDSTASGAGPTTALTGTAASFSGAVVTLDGSPDLSGVATDGSHVLYMVTSTGMRFFKITAKDDTLDTVTVTPNPAGTSTGRTWAIGGKRASVSSASSLLLFDNSGSAGDAMPGWTVEMQSAHAESGIAAPIIFRRSGDTTDGRITLRGTPGAVTTPLLTFSNAGRAIDVTTAVVNLITVEGFELRSTQSTKSTSTLTAVDCGSSNYNNAGLVVRGMKIAHATDKFNRGVITSEYTTVEGCEVGYTNSSGIDCVANAFSTARGVEVAGNRCHHCGVHGIFVDCMGNGDSAQIMSNICHDNATNGIRATNAKGMIIQGNTCHDNGAAGLYLTMTSNAPARVRNNQITLNGTYGVDFNGASAEALSALIISHNNTYGNTSGAYSTAGVAASDPAIDPDYVNAAGGDFTPQEPTLEGAAFPVSIP